MSLDTKRGGLVGRRTSVAKKEEQHPAPCHHIQAVQGDEKAHGSEKIPPKGKSAEFHRFAEGVFRREVVAVCKSCGGRGLGHRLAQRAGFCLRAGAAIVSGLGAGFFGNSLAWG